MAVDTLLLEALDLLGVSLEAGGAIEIATYNTIANSLTVELTAAVMVKVQALMSTLSGMSPLLVVVVVGITVLGVLSVLSGKVTQAQCGNGPAESLFPPNARDRLV